MISLITTLIFFTLKSSASASTTLKLHHSNVSGQVLQCLSCTTMDIEHVFVSLQNVNWQQRILNAPFAPKTTACKDLSTQEKMAQSNLKPVDCENGICGQMFIKETNGDIQIYRSCINNTNFELHSNCTKVSTSEDIVYAKICLCATPLCNVNNSGARYTLHYMTLLVITVVAVAFIK